MSKEIIEELYKDLVDMYFDFVCDFYIPNDLTDELYGFILDVEKDLNQTPYYKVYKYSDSQPRGENGRWIDAGGSGGSSGGADDRQARHLYDKMTKKERKEVIQRGQNEAKPIFSYDRPDNKAMSYLQKTPKEPDTFDVISHGSVNSMEFFRQDYPPGDRRSLIDAYTLSCILKGREDYKAFVADCKSRNVKPTVRLLSCNTGNTTNTGNCFAQLLANELGHNVTAPTDLLYTESNGKIKVGLLGNGKIKPFYSRKN